MQPEVRDSTFNRHPVPTAAEFLAAVEPELETKIASAVKCAVGERAPDVVARVAECLNPAAADELAELRREVARLREENEGLRGEDRAGAPQGRRHPRGKAWESRPPRAAPGDVVRVVLLDDSDPWWTGHHVGHPPEMAG